MATEAQIAELKLLGFDPNMEVSSAMATLLAESARGRTYAPAASSAPNGFGSGGLLGSVAPPAPTAAPAPIPALPSTSTGLLASTVGTAQAPQPPMAGWEDDDAVTELNKITASGSEYIKQAEASGLALANRRGLLNSSIAAGAARGAAYDRAQPLALANAQARSARNLTRLDAAFQADRQTLDIASKEKIVAAQIASEEARLGRQLTSNEKIAAEANALSKWQSQLQADTNLSISANELRSREAMNAAQLASQASLAQMDIRSREALQAQQIAATAALTERNIAAEEARLGRQLSSQEKQAAEELASRQAIAQLQSQTSLQQQQLQEQGATDRANLDAATRTQLAAQENLNATQRAQLAYYSEQNRAYQSSLDNLYANKDMPSAAREDAIAQFTALRNANLDMAKAALGANMNWGTTAPATTPAATPPATTTPPVAAIAPADAAPAVVATAPVTGEPATYNGGFAGADIPTYYAGNGLLGGAGGLYAQQVLP